MDAQVAVVVLAAGQGTRMRSNLPKVLHRLAGQPMIEHVLHAVAGLSPARVVVVLGHGADAVGNAISVQAEIVVQEPQRGTAHAVLQASKMLKDHPDDLVVVYGDTPLLRADTLAELLDQHRRSDAEVTLLSAVVDDPEGYGRVLRSGTGTVEGIVEQASATGEQAKIREINSGVYCFRSQWLWSHLDRVQRNAKGEYYLTDVVAMAKHEGLTVTAVQAADAREALGINTRVQLAEADAVLRWRIRRELMLFGVTMHDPASAFIDSTVRIGRDTVIYPNCVVEGATEIGEDCVIGPNTYLRDAQVGDGCRVVASMVEDSVLGVNVNVGPFSHLRNGAMVGAHAQIGNFAEIKKSRVGAGTKMHHFSYLGDAEVGTDVNVGAGTITCNFNSETGAKSKTTIEDNAALGSDTLLVAPVRVGRGATTGAGSVVTRDIPEDSVAYGVPAKVVRKVRKSAR